MKCSGDPDDEVTPKVPLYPIFNFRENAALQKAKNQDSLFKTSPSLNSGKVKKPRKKSTISIKRAKRKLPFMNAEHQYAIDVGQRNFDAQRCTICNMLYTKGEEQDENHHQKYHDRFVNSIKFNGWKNQRVVQYFDDGARILLVKADDPRHMLKKMDDLFTIADLELGINTSVFDNLEMDNVFLIYLTGNRRIAGFVAGEPVKFAYEFIAEEGIAIIDKKIPVELGVSRLWVHYSQRRCGVATRLIDTLRCCIDPKKIIPKALVAFTDPTAPGNAFAAKYTGRQNILVDEPESGSNIGIDESEKIEPKEKFKK